MSEHNLVQTPTGTWTCKDSLGMACSSNTWIDAKSGFQSHLAFMESLKPENVKYRWGIRRYDVDDRPIVMELDPPNSNEKTAREWHESFMDMWKGWCEHHPDHEPPHAPELVRTPLIWQVVE